MLSVRPGGLLAAGRLTDAVGLVVSVHPDRVGGLGPKVPAKYRGFSVILQLVPFKTNLGLRFDGPETEA